MHAAARVMDVDIVTVEPDERGRMMGAALTAAIDQDGDDGLFAVVANAGTTNTGAIDELDAIADICERLDLWLHIDGAYGGATLCAPSMKQALRGFERADSFGIDPHKWLFAPYDSAALVYRDPQLAAEAHAQHGDYLDAVDRSESNPSDLAFHLSRRARGLPLWFSLATHGTDAYADAVERTLATAQAFARNIDDRPGFTLLLEPQMSVVLFEVDGWERARYEAWTASRPRGHRADRADHVAGPTVLPDLPRQPVDHDRDARGPRRRHGRLRRLIAGITNRAERNGARRSGGPCRPPVG